jgi:GTP cyclohydrolase I/GTP cyclohydrolase-4
MVRMAVEEFASLGPQAFIYSRQENLETIHQHNVVAERFGLMEELQREIASDEVVPHHVSMREWLDGA